MDLTYKQEVGVGAFVLVGVAVFLVGMFWLTGQSLRTSGMSVDVMFESVAGLKQGDPVLVSGVKKGRVARVSLERVRSVRVTLEISRDVRPHIDASAAVAALDLFGARFIDYSPGTPEKELLPSGRLLTGANQPDITDVAQGVANRANELMENAASIVSDRLGEDIHNTLIVTQRAMNALADAPEGPFVKQTTRTLQATERLMQRVDSMLGSGTGANIDSVSRNLALLTQRLTHATAALDTLLTRMNRGEGTLGKMAADTMMYANLRDLSASLTALLTDLKENPDKYMKPGLVRVKLF
ncbi:MAG TPA: MlaD family protein [Gemmatimonadales bacterium]|nr:MlaD family protein [Gemmatimonadales bacterium]